MPLVALLAVQVILVEMYMIGAAVAMDPILG